MTVPLPKGFPLFIDDVGYRHLRAALAVQDGEARVPSISPQLLTLPARICAHCGRAPWVSPQGRVPPMPPLPASSRMSAPPAPAVLQRASRQQHPPLTLSAGSPAGADRCVAGAQCRRPRCCDFFFHVLTRRVDALAPVRARAARRLLTRRRGGPHQAPPGRAGHRLVHGIETRRDVARAATACDRTIRNNNNRVGLERKAGDILKRAALFRRKPRITRSCLAPTSSAAGAPARPHSQPDWRGYGVRDAMCRADLSARRRALMRRLADCRIRRRADAVALHA